MAELSRPRQVVGTVNFKIPPFKLFLVISLPRIVMTDHRQPLQHERCQVPRQHQHRHACRREAPTQMTRWGTIFGIPSLGDLTPTPQNHHHLTCTTHQDTRFHPRTYAPGVPEYH
ncbi:hypothetical protein R3P38DRAFT_3206321 [Favolaschia claudopus]|uniref:Uncharacterized protein n=1 Tax=Favolaschia claudopus TaxID=2862362 RepID=A0AAW0AL28_9AGAR